MINVDDLYSFPPLDSDAELDSFDFTSPQFNMTKEPKELKAKVLSRMEQLWAAARFDIAEDFLEDSHILRIMEDVRSKNMKKTPGAILMRQGMTTIGEVYDKLGEQEILRQVRQRLRQLLEDDPKYAADPVRIFVKPEPHKQSKVADKRWRLIKGVSLIDQLVVRLLHQEQQEKETSVWTRIPSKVGLGFKLGTTQQLFDHYDNDSEKWWSFDAKAFDTSVSGWQQEWLAELDVRLCDSIAHPKYELWCKLVRNRALAAAFGSYVFSNGAVIRKILGGEQLSGDFLTIMKNGKNITMTRVMYDVSHGLPTRLKDVIAMGDDSLQDNLPEASDYISWTKEKTGIHLTIENDGKPGKLIEQNFCSQKFLKDQHGTHVSVPLNRDKMIFKLSHPEKGRTEQEWGGAFQTLCLEYCYDAEVFPWLYAILAKNFKPYMRSRQQFEHITTGAENS